MGVLSNELVKTAALRVDLWLRERERRRLMAAFPPRTVPACEARRRALLLVPALFILAAGLSALTLRQAQRPAFTGERAFALEGLPLPLARPDPAALEGLPPPLARPDTVALDILSEPLGARAVATWPGGRSEGVTPFSTKVPRGARVHLVYDRESFAPYSIDVIANTAQRAVGHLYVPPRPLGAR